MSVALVKIGDVLEVQNGFAFSSSQFAPDGGIGLIRIRDLRGGTETAVRYTGEYDPDYVVRAGDLLIGMDGEFRCYEWKGRDALLNQRVCRLRNFSENVEPRYLLYGLNAHLKAIEDETGFVTVKHLSSKTIKSIEMPLPSIEEQVRITELLDQTVRLSREVESAFAVGIAKAQDLRQSILNAAFRGEL
jgi:type I restriction enzyme, S subunit